MLHTSADVFAIVCSRRDCGSVQVFPVSWCHKPRPVADQQCLLRLVPSLPVVSMQLAAPPPASPAPAAAPVPAAQPQKPRVANNVVPHVTSTQKSADPEQQQQQQDVWSSAEPVRSLA